MNQVNLYFPIQDLRFNDNPALSQALEQPGLRIACFLNDFPYDLGHAKSPGTLRFNQYLEEFLQDLSGFGFKTYSCDLSIVRQLLPVQTRQIKIFLNRVKSPWYSHWRNRLEKFIQKELAKPYDLIEFDPFQEFEDQESYKAFERNYLNYLKSRAHLPGKVLREDEILEKDFPFSRVLCGALGALEVYQLCFRKELLNQEYFTLFSANHYFHFQGMRNPNFTNRFSSARLKTAFKMDMEGALANSNTDFCALLTEVREVCSDKEINPWDLGYYAGLLHMYGRLGFRSLVTFFTNHTVQTDQVFLSGIIHQVLHDLPGMRAPFPKPEIKKNLLSKELSLRLESTLSSCYEEYCRSYHACQNREPVRDTRLSVRRLEKIFKG